MANEVKLKLAIEGGQVVGVALDGVGSKLEDLGKSAKDAAFGADAVATALKSLAAAGSALAAIKMADSITTLNTQLRLSANNAKEASQAFNALFDIAQRSRVSFVELGTTYAAIARAGNEIGVSQARLLTVTQSISQAMTIGGGSAAGMQAALIQLGQGLSSGTLRGEELNSVMEQTPRLAKAIADGLGIPIGELRKLGETGQITAEKLISALEKSAPQLAREMASATVTVSQAFTMLTNSATKFVGDADAASGASGSLASAMMSLSGAIDTMGSTIKNNETAFASIAYGLAGAATIAGVGGLAKVIVLRLIPALAAAAAAAGPIGWIALAIGAIGGAAVAASSAWSKSAQGMAADAAKLSNEIAAIDKTMAAGLNDRGYKATAADNAELKALREKLVARQALMSQQLALQQAGNVETSAEDARLARSTAAYKAQDKALRAFNAAGGDYLSTAAKNQATMSKEIDTARAAFELGAITAAQYAKRINDVQASFAKGTPHITEAAKAQKLLNDLNLEAMGFKPDFAAQWISLSKTQDGTKGLTVAQAELLKQQPLMKDAAEKQAKAIEASAKMMDAAAKAAASYRDANLKDLASMEESNTKLAEHNQEIGLTVDELDQLRLSRLDDALAVQEQVRSMMNLQNSSQEEIDTMEQRIKLLKEQRSLTAAGQDLEVSSKAAKSAAEEWKKTSDSINQSLTDALMRGWESGKTFAENFRDTVVNMFKTLVLQPVISAIVSPVSMGISSMMGLSGAANAANAVGGAASAANGASILSGLSGWFTNFGESATQALYSAGEKVYSMGFESLGKSMMGNLNEAGGFSAMADKLNMVGNGLGYLNATMLAAGGQWGAAIGAGIGTYFGGPLGSMLGQAVGGWVDNAFGGGHEYTTGGGITGRFSSAGFSGRNYQDWRNDGSSGFFGIGGSGSSSGRNYSGMSQGASDQLSAGFASIQFAASGMAIALGLDAKKVLGFTKDITVALSSDAEANKKAIADLMASIADEIASTVAPSITGFAKDGETASATLARLSTSIITANAWLSMLRQRLFQVSLAGGDAASKLADAFGGLDQLSASSKAFYDTYYSSGEKVAASQEAMTNALAAYGIALPTNKAALRDLVDAMDLNTQGGREAYAVLLKLAPQFAETATLVDQMATDTAVSLIKAFTANGKLVPALNAASLSMSGIPLSAEEFVGGINQVHQVMLDTSSPVLTFNGYVTKLSTALTGAQSSALDLYDQIDALSGASSKAVIDFKGLNAALDGVDTVTFVATISAVFDSLATRITSTIDSITAERVALREAALQIVSPTTMSKQSIKAGISGINTILPGNSGLIAANTALGAANAAQTVAQSKAATMASNLLNAQGVLSAAQSYAAALPATFNAARQQLYDAGNRHDIRANSYELSGGAIDGNHTAYRYNAATNRLSNYDYISYWGHGASEIGQYKAEYGNAVVILDAANAALAQSEQAVASAQSTVSGAMAESAAANLAAANAGTAQTAAAKAASKALLDYQAALQNFAIDASKSVSKLSNLRQETVKYYEAQKQLADLMGASATGLLSTVQNYRFSQLSPEAQSASLQSQFATAYSMAQASQGDGATLAGYADKLNNMLAPLIDSLNATGQGGLIGSFLAQAEVVAKLLQDNAPQNYAADSLAMLSDIDATLAALDASSKSAEQVISDAVRAGSDRTAAGLFAVIQALTGKSIPAFAGGGYHSGGARWVGENGPELEVTGPSRIFNGAQLRSMGQGGSTAYLEALVAEQNKRFEAMSYELQAIALSTGKTANVFKRVSSDGETLNVKVSA